MEAFTVCILLLYIVTMKLHPRDRAGWAARRRMAASPASSEVDDAYLASICSNGRVAALRKIIASNPEAARRPGLAVIAAEFGEQGVLEMLVDSGADVDESKENDVDECMCALDHAVRRSDPDLVKFLCSRSCRVTDNVLARAREAEVARRDDATWSRCAAQCTALLTTARSLRARRRLRAAGRTVAVLLAWHARAAERVYAPGGVGFEDAALDFALRSRRLLGASGGEGCSEEVSALAGAVEVSM